MGIYLNPGYENFKEIIRSPYYVDKTMVIQATNKCIDTGNKYICISRPRRFGKTVASNTISAYYAKGLNSGELFAPYKISKDPSFAQKLNAYNVIKIDLNSEYQNTLDKSKTLKRLTREIKQEMSPAFPDVQFEKDDLFTYLIHLGYLAYNLEDSTCRIPNKEVRQEWFNAIETEPGYEVTTQIIQASKELLQKTWELNSEAVAKALDVSHIHVTSNRSYNNEEALQSAIYLAFIYALNRYTAIKEATSGKGFADVVYIPIKATDPAMIIELKRNSSSQSALQQIEQKQYFDSLAHYSGNLLFVGINYDEKTKTHECEIKKFVKS